MAIVFGLQHIPDVELRRISTFRTHVAKFQRFMTTILDLLCKKNREDELIQIVRYACDGVSSPCPVGQGLTALK